MQRPAAIPAAPPAAPPAVLLATTVPQSTSLVARVLWPSRQTTPARAAHPGTLHPRMPALQAPHRCATAVEQLRAGAPRAPIDRRTQPILTSQRRARAHMRAAPGFTARAAPARRARPVPGQAATWCPTARRVVKLTTASVPRNRHTRRHSRRPRRPRHPRRRPRHPRRHNRRRWQVTATIVGANSAMAAGHALPMAPLRIPLTLPPSCPQ